MCSHEQPVAIELSDLICLPPSTLFLFPRESIYHHKQVGLHDTTQNKHCRRVCEMRSDVELMINRATAQVASGCVGVVGVPVIRTLPNMNQRNSPCSGAHTTSSVSPSPSHTHHTAHRTKHTPQITQHVHSAHESQCSAPGSGMVWFTQQQHEGAVSRGAH